MQTTTTISNTLSSSSDAASPWTSHLNADAPFPSKLYQMLEFAEHTGLDYIVSWLPHGRAFKIHNKEEFMIHVAAHFFKATKLRSVHRQLNLWGFKRIPNGNQKDAWFHDSFLRGRQDEMKNIIRTKIKGKTLFAAKRDQEVPNFDLMPSIQTDQDSYVSDLDDELDHIMANDKKLNQAMVNHVTPPRSMVNPRRVSITSLPSPSISMFPSPESDNSAPHKTKLSHCNRYSPSSKKAAQVSRPVIEPLPFGVRDAALSHIYYDEFSLFIDQTIHDPSI